MLVLQNLNYKHPDKELLFKELHLSIKRRDKIALVGNNGTGKSTLLKIISGELLPTEGTIISEAPPYYIPQLLDQLDKVTVAEALRIDKPLKALAEILEGNVSEENLAILNDDWSIEERSLEALAKWKLSAIHLSQKMSCLSGGEKTKVLLAGIDIHKPEFIVMDEPSNHLDGEGRLILYNLIEDTNATLLVVSHDKALLDLLSSFCELTQQGIVVYGGGYEFYLEQKRLAVTAIYQEVQHVEKTLRKAKEKQIESLERQQKLNARGKAKQGKEGVARIMMNTLRNNAEKSTTKLKGVHTEKIENLSMELKELRTDLPLLDRMKLDFDHSDIHKGKILFKATAINFSYTSDYLWSQDLSFEILSGERIALKSMNGSGKSTLIKIILGELAVFKGSVYHSENQSIYMDQHYTLLRDSLTVYEQAQQFNLSQLQEHEIKVRLNRFLFTKRDWDKPCNVLSGGERMRLILCCLTIQKRTPDIIVLDEPSNNLDIQNTEILTTAIKDYRGTVIVVSHDEYFLEQVRVTRTICLD